MADEELMFDGFGAPLGAVLGATPYNLDQTVIQMRKNDTDNWVTIPQPDEDGWGYAFETTYTSDSKRIQTGVLQSSQMFTVEQWQYKATNLTAAEAQTLLQLVAKGGVIQLSYYSPYYGAWRAAPFYIGKGSLKIGRILSGTARIDEISFNLEGVNPL